MIDWVSRYQTEMNDIFSEEKKIELQVRVELSLLKALGELGRIPLEAFETLAREVKEKNVSVKRVKEIEAETHHDIMAMVKALGELSPEYGEYVHYGATSQDINDTVLGLQLKEAKKLLLEASREVRKELTRLAETYADTPCIGRTHGQHAIPITIGFKFANFLYELSVAESFLRDTKVELGKFSGAVGTFATLGTKEVQNRIMKELGLEPAPITTQVISRTHLSQYMFALASMASVLDRIAKEIRNLQRTEIGEWMEGFGKKQVGSSTMPQKRNPHKSERICGIARIVRSQVMPILEAIPLEHERDLTNSSTERIAVPTASILLHYMLKEAKKILHGLVINLDRVNQNLHYLQGKQLAERIMIALTDKLGRQTAHEILRVYSAHNDFVDRLRQDERIREALSTDELDELLNPETYIGLAPQVTRDIIKEYGVKPPKSYEEAGVSIALEEKGIKALQEWVKKSQEFHKEHVVEDIGNYTGYVKIDKYYVAMTTDGVGSKILIAQEANKHYTVGIDCVAMNVNDLLANGFEPRAFVDYLAVKQPDAELLHEIGKGLYDGARQAHIPVVGGETATIPEIIQGKSELAYDLAGTAIGVVESEDNIITGKNIEIGDVIIGLKSSGLHSNGFTLARKVIFSKYKLNDTLPWGITVREELLRPTRIYVDQVKRVLRRVKPHGMAHITGSGVLNLKRLTNYGFLLDKWPDPPKIFQEIKEIGDISYEEMFKTFNMGIGYVFIVAPEKAQQVIDILKEIKENALILGTVSRNPSITIPRFGVKYDFK